MKKRAFDIGSGGINGDVQYRTEAIFLKDVKCSYESITLESVAELRLVACDVKMPK
jgi:hypothetical protein